VKPTQKVQIKIDPDMIATQMRLKTQNDAEHRSDAIVNHFNIDLLCSSEGEQRRQKP
jgi:hypothetical protein